MFATHSSTSLLKGFLLFPRNSPIICRLRPFLWSRKCATPMGVSGMKPREIRNWRPLSGFLGRMRKRERKWMKRSVTQPLRMSCPVYWNDSFMLKVTMEWSENKVGRCIPAQCEWSLPIVIKDTLRSLICIHSHAQLQHSLMTAKQLDT